METNLFEACETCLQDEPAATTARCPVHVDIALLCSELEKGEFKKAYKVLEKRIPFAGIIGMICDHPCETVCVRTQLDQAVQIHDLERAAVMYGRTPLKKIASAPKKNGKIAVVGGGISGITAAFELDKRGFQVTIFEADRRLGGRIWDYEGSLISKELIEEELKLIGRIGVRVVYNSSIGTGELKKLAQEYDAVYLGTGRWESELFINQETFQILDWPIFAGGRLINQEKSAAGRSNDSVIDSVSTAKRAALSIERFVKKISMTASREREGSYQTPLVYDMDDVITAQATMKTGETYTEEEAIQEAGRCLKCRCVTCLKACSHLQHFNVTPKSYGRQIQINESVIMGTRYANPMINSCTLCGLCKEQCPLGIGMKELVRETRESMVEKNKMPPSAHDFALRDMEFSNSSQFYLVKPPPSETTYKQLSRMEAEQGNPSNQGVTISAEKVKYLFYPGCQLSASCPDYVEKSYRYLLEKKTDGVGLMLGCCGAPADWAGRKDMMAESTQRIRRVWSELGEPIFILACSSCIGTFERYLPEIPYFSLWEVLEQLGLPEEAVSGKGRKLNVHDSCSTRNNQAVHESVRKLAFDLDYEIEELHYSKSRTKCCGYGGLVYFANKEQAEQFAVERILESGKDLLVYCAMCKDLFIEKGKRTFHILDLIFGNASDADALRTMPNLSDRHENRAVLKRKLLRELWGENEMEELKQPNDWNLQIPQEIWERMEKRFILLEDIKKVIEHAKVTGERFFNPEDESYLASHRIKYVTYWVRFAEQEDGIHVLSVYSHRMEVMKE
ncbi:FAD-dependent oxidoreductase [Anoxybacterium hadale]|uniref:FAD-dependent oxidoreductase n=1 Tax=Anoxybacterium hadale TaxID=3408580 RepID=A0ACD1A8J6_9FIRM|nr:FAD-dependent oxidoreductase [Clostridiales bacterium]